jgi:hypothetical protein
VGIENLIDLYLLKKDNENLKEFNLQEDKHFSGKFIVLTICKHKTIEPIKNFIYSDDCSNGHYDLSSRFNTDVCNLLSIPSSDYSFITKGGGEIIVSPDSVILTGTSGRFGKYDSAIAKQLCDSYCKRSGIKGEPYIE